MMAKRNAAMAQAAYLDMGINAVEKAGTGKHICNQNVVLFTEM